LGAVHNIFTAPKVRYVFWLRFVHHKLFIKSAVILIAFFNFKNPSLLLPVVFN